MILWNPWFLSVDVRFRNYLIQYRLVKIWMRKLNQAQVLCLLLRWKSSYVVILFITYRSKIKSFHWSIALFNIFRRIARYQNWTKLHDKRHIIKEYNTQVQNKAVYYTQFGKTWWTHPLGLFNRFDQPRAIHFFVLLLHVVLLFDVTLTITIWRLMH